MDLERCLLEYLESAAPAALTIRQIVDGIGFNITSGRSVSNSLKSLAQQGRLIEGKAGLFTTYRRNMSSSPIFGVVASNSKRRPEASQTCTRYSSSTIGPPELCTREGLRAISIPMEEREEPAMVVSYLMELMAQIYPKTTCARDVVLAHELEPSLVVYAFGVLVRRKRVNKIIVAHDLLAHIYQWNPKQY